VLRIRLRRVGKKKQPNYRVVVADSRAPRDGAFIETIGTYNPLTNPASVSIDEAKARDWLSKGAVPSDRVTVLLAKQGIGEMPVYEAKPRKEKPAKGGEAAATAAPAAAPAAAAAEAPASAEVPEQEAAPEA
jgi:small subunit ribosomal protein S16